jgi:GDP-4-dehydro-6-deoxy-D-mannose reductase
MHSGRPTKPKSKRLFVTGGHGFVGHWMQSLANEIFERYGFELAIPPEDYDLLDPTHVDAQFAVHRPDAVLHLAAQSNVPLSFRDPEGTFRVNLIGTLRMFEGIKRAGLSPRVVLASSGDVYGQVPAEQMPITEDRVPHPRSPYAVSKLATEALCYQWCQTERMDVVIARPFNHIGAGQSDAFVVPAIARQIIEIKKGRRPPIIEVGNIDVSRDFTHVSDVVSAYLTLIERGQPGESYNIASGTDRSVRSILEHLLVLSGVTAEVRRNTTRFRLGEQSVVRGGNAKISRLGWRPARSMDEALREVIQDWEQRIAKV